MSPEAKRLTMGWAALIAFAALVLSILSGFGGGMRAVGQFEGRVQSLESCTKDNKAEIVAARDKRNQISTEFSAKIATLNTDVKYIVKAVDEIKRDIRRP